MSTTTAVETVQTLTIRKEIEIAADVETTWAATLAELGPEGQMPDGRPFPMKLEAWPGGRWFRDLGNGAGHLWCHVQVIKPPTLLELYGPMFMSYPAQNFVQYRITPTSAGSRLILVHRAMGIIPESDRQGVGDGWEYSLRRIKQFAQR